MINFNDTPDNTIYKIRQRLSGISIRKAFLYTVIFLLPFLFILLMFSVSETLTGLWLDLLAGITFYIVPLILIWYAFYKKNLSLKPILIQNIHHRKDLVMVVPLMMFSFGVIWVVLLLLNQVDSGLAQEYLDFLNSVELFHTTPETPFAGYILLFFAVAVLPALFEEIVFRGAMLERLGRKYSYKTAVILSSALFGVLHVDIIGALMMGLILSLIYLKTYSLFIPIIIHACNNGLIVMYIFIDDQFLQLEPWDTVDSYTSTGWIGIILLVISSTWLVLYLKQNWGLVYQKEPVA